MSATAQNLEKTLTFENFKLSRVFGWMSSEYVGVTETLRGLTDSECCWCLMIAKDWHSDHPMYDEHWLNRSIWSNRCH